MSQRPRSIPSSRSLALALCAVPLLALPGCRDATAAEERVTLRTEVVPATAAVGDTVLLRAILHNPTSRRAEFALCGPPVLFEVRTPAAAIVYPIPLDAAFACPGLDVHLLEPGERDTVSVRWRVTGDAGLYAVRSGFREGAGLARRSAPASLRAE